MTGPLLSMGFIYLFSEVDPRSSEAMFNFTDRALQLGFEGAFFAGLITMLAIAVPFAIFSWFALRSWGPLRYRADG
jgi:hypothetical protein